MPFTIQDDLIVTNDIFGTLTGNVSGNASTSTSASFASTASLAPNYVLTSTTSSMLTPYLLISNTSSFATTGSNTFIGNQTITGSLVVSSSNIAQFVVGNNLLRVSSSGQLGVSGSIIPNVHNTYTLGTTSVRFATLFIQGTVNANTGLFNNLNMGSSTPMSIINNQSNTVAQWYGLTANLRMQSGSTPAYTDNGYRLQINSLGAVSGGLYITGSANQSLIKIDAPGKSNILLVSSSGNIGIGTNSPNAKLTVIVASAETALNLSDGSTSDFSVTPGVSSGVVRVGPGTGQMALYSANSEAIRIDTSQNVGIGTTSPSERFHIQAAGTGTDTALFISGNDTKGGTGYLDFLRVENTDSGVTTPKKHFRINNTDGAWEVVNDGYSQVIMSLADNGDMAIAGTLTQNSDISLKTNIQTIPNALEKTLQLRGVEYDKISTNKHEIGLIAQEVEQVFPELVSEANGIKSVAYSNVVSILVESIKQLKQEIDILREQINKN